MLGMYFIVKTQKFTLLYLSSPHQQQQQSLIHSWITFITPSRAAAIIVTLLNKGLSQSSPPLSLSCISILLQQSPNFGFLSESPSLYSIYHPWTTNSSHSVYDTLPFTLPTMHSLSYVKCVPRHHSKYVRVDDINSTPQRHLHMRVLTKLANSLIEFLPFPFKLL